MMALNFINGFSGFILCKYFAANRLIHLLNKIISY